MKFILEIITAYKLGRMILRQSADKQAAVFCALLEDKTAISRAMNKPPSWSAALAKPNGRGINSALKNKMK